MQMIKLISIIYFFVIMGCFLFFSCSQGKKEEVISIFPLEIALSYAGENRVEFEKVLSHYRTCSLYRMKYKVAYFFIENMTSYINSMKVESRYGYRIIEIIFDSFNSIYELAICDMNETSLYHLLFN